MNGEWFSAFGATLFLVEFVAYFFDPFDTGVEEVESALECEGAVLVAGCAVHCDFVFDDFDLGAEFGVGVVEEVVLLFARENVEEEHAGADGVEGDGGGGFVEGWFEPICEFVETCFSEGVVAGGAFAGLGGSGFEEGGFFESLDEGVDGAFAALPV